MDGDDPSGSQPDRSPCKGAPYQKQTILKKFEETFQRSPWGLEGQEQHVVGSQEDVWQNWLESYQDPATMEAAKGKPEAFLLSSELVLVDTTLTMAVDSF